MTSAEIAAYNRGVNDVLAIARQSAERIVRTSSRQHHTGFAADALAELAQAGRALLIAPPRAASLEGPQPGGPVDEEDVQ